MAAFAEGVPCWADAMLPDLEAGKRFYGELFGWTFGAGEPRYGRYTQAFHHGRNVAALAPKPDGRMPTVWNIYFAAQDAAATAARIRAADGRLITEPMRIGDFGAMATAVDPGGAVFGVWQAGSHPGFEEHGAPGSYGWSELRTRDPERVDAFYRAVFGYGTVRQGGQGGQGGQGEADVVFWAPRGKPAEPGYAIGARTVMGDRFPAEMPAHFLTYFVVANCDEAARTAHALGGRLLNDPENTPYGRFAVLADNQGALFAVVDTSAARTSRTESGA
ncbi:VOC family protein [Streptomyces sp. ME19-01-6]|uniref:VOC family protein n=1 Tax=Streptomyces sp. ME19-01-6 TaxID=3028686 RepID=UPI0029A3CB03|nr:VOC family protein [Streptomyces sp. ME19-01-6]MDX3226371.1 VOC family protein [Streptomyces sp. ME19-01-6]